MQLSDFQTYVLYDFKRTDKNTELVRAYNDMIFWVASKMPHGDYKFQSYLTTVAGQEDYALPSNMIHLLHPIRLLLGSATTDSGYQLTRVSKTEYDERFPNPNRTSPQTSRPGWYCIYSRSVLLGPIPDLSTYLLEINWSKLPTEQSASSDTPGLGNEWDEILKYGTLERLYEGIGMTDEATIYRNKYKDAEGNPIGVCADLFNEEMDRETPPIGAVEPRIL